MEATMELERLTLWWCSRGDFRAGEKDDKYLRLNLASMLWFARQTTFIFLQHTHTHARAQWLSQQRKFGDFSCWIGPCEHLCACIRTHNRIHTHIHVSPQPRIGPQLQIQGAGWVTHSHTHCQSNFICSSCLSPSFFPIMPLSFQHLSTQTKRLHCWLQLVGQAARQCSRFRSTRKIYFKKSVLHFFIINTLSSCKSNHTVTFIIEVCQEQISDRNVHICALINTLGWEKSSHLFILHSPKS